MQLIDERLDAFLEHVLPVVRCLTIDGALDGKDRIDAFDRVKRDRQDRSCVFLVVFFPAASSMTASSKNLRRACPAGRFPDQARQTRFAVERIEPAIGINPQYAASYGSVLARRNPR